jgi:hypothetical protein
MAKGGRVRPSTRRQLFMRVEQLMRFTDLSPETWQARWMEVAADKQRWHKLMRKWRHDARQVASRGEWHHKHAPGGEAERRQQRQAARLQSVANIELDPAGNGQCPHCEGVYSSRALLMHVSQCAHLSEAQKLQARKRREQRARRLEQDLRAGRTLSDRKRAELAAIRSAAVAPPAASTSSRRYLAQPAILVRRRIVGKQAPPPLYRMLRLELVRRRQKRKHGSATFVQVVRRRLTSKTTVRARSARDRYLEAVAAAGTARVRKVRGRNAFVEVAGARRLGSVGDLPAPPRPPGHRMDKCFFCNAVFPTVDKCSLHLKTYLRMRYDMWLARVRICQNLAGADCPCPHCGTQFTTKKGASRHAFECARRRRLFRLPLGTEEYHATAGDAAQVVVHQRGAVHRRPAASQH